MNAEPMTDARLAQLRTINAGLAKCGRKMWGPGLSPFGDPTDVAADAIEDLLAEIDRLRAEVKTLEDAHPFRNAKPSNHEATGNDLIDRLRGIYRTPINDGAGPLDGKDHYERRFAVGELSHHAADHIENLIRGLAEAHKDTERLDWLANGGLIAFVGFMTCKGGNLPFREAIDAARAEQEAYEERIKNEK